MVLLKDESLSGSAHWEAVKVETRKCPECGNPIGSKRVVVYTGTKYSDEVVDECWTCNPPEGSLARERMNE